jgi:hypothetical protein
MVFLSNLIAVTPMETEATGAQQRNVVRKFIAPVSGYFCKHKDLKGTCTGGSAAQSPNIPKSATLVPQVSTNFRRNGFRQDVAAALFLQVAKMQAKSFAEIMDLTIGPSVELDPVLHFPPPPQ